MNTEPDNGLARALVAPASLASCTEAEWTLLIQAARRAGLLGRLASGARSLAHAEALPAAVSAHFDSALRLCEAQRAEVTREVKYLSLALGDLGTPIVLLKGAAYAMAELPAAEGRIFGDVDVLVPRASLDEVESRLLMHGWMGTHDVPYDQMYYRRWMHELPPMQHTHRGTVLDVHHSLVPSTARLPFDPRPLFDRLHPLPALPGIHVLAPEDMVLHSMTHLFLNDDLTHALRDLSDLDVLVRHFGRQAGFWDELPRRAIALNLTRLLYYGLRHLERVFATPVPADVRAQLSPYGPAGALSWLMDTLWRRALTPSITTSARASDALTQFSLYVRGHWLRMPLPLLLRHLTVKAWMRVNRRDEAAAR